MNAVQDYGGCIICDIIILLSVHRESLPGKLRSGEVPLVLLVQHGPPCLPQLRLRHFHFHSRPQG